MPCAKPAQLGQRLLEVDLEPFDLVVRRRARIDHLAHQRQPQHQCASVAAGRCRGGRARVRAVRDRARRRSARVTRAGRAGSPPRPPRAPRSRAPAGRPSRPRGSARDPRRARGRARSRSPARRRASMAVTTWPGPGAGARTAVPWASHQARFRVRQNSRRRPGSPTRLAQHRLELGEGRTPQRLLDAAPQHPPGVELRADERCQEPVPERRRARRRSPTGRRCADRRARRRSATSPDTRAG